MRVIITDADDKKGLAIVRALGKRGVETCLVGGSWWDMALYSRYTGQRVLSPNPARRFEEYCQFMLDFVARHKFDCMLMGSDYTCLAASKYKSEFEKHVKVPVPDYDTARLARDKLAMTRLAESLGIGSPKTYAPETKEELDKVAAEITYPCVVKYRKGTGAIGIRYPRTAEELMEMHYSPKRPDAVFEDLAPLIQEYIPGDIHDVCTVFAHGEPRAALTHVRVKTWPESGGRGIVDLTTDEPDLREAGVRLLREIKWHGPAQVEFKLDPRDGRYKLMEINARFWGGIDEMIQLGIDVAWMSVQIAVEGDCEPQFDYPVGRIYRWPFPHLFARTLREEHKLKALKDFFFPGKGVKNDIQLSDPLPHAVATAHAAYLGLRRVTGI